MLDTDGYELLMFAISIFADLAHYQDCSNITTIMQNIIAYLFDMALDNLSGPRGVEVLRQLFLSKGQLLM